MDSASADAIERGDAHDVFAGVSTEESGERRAPWLAALLVLPGKVAIGVLSMLAGVGAARRAGASTQGSALSGLAGLVVSQVVLNVASSASERREREEARLAQCADEDRMAWSDALQAVGKIVSKFANGLNVPAGLKYVFLDRSLVLLYHENVVRKHKNAARQGTPSTNSVLVAGRYYSEYAMAAYGYLLLKFLGMMDPSHDFLVDGMRTIDVVKYRLRLADEDILVARLDGEVIGMPRHFVAIDNEMHTIVVTIRGTNSISDVITDLLCGNEPFAAGYAHAGMKDAAESLYTAILPTLRAALAERHDYSVVVCGHSLGGGVAMLLTKLLLMNGFSNTKCYAIAPCPVFGPRHKIDAEWSDAIECYVHDDDLVSQLCLSSARNLALEIERVDTLPLSAADRREIMKKASAERLTNMIDSERRVTVDPRENDVQHLYIPTRRGVNWLLPCEDSDDDIQPVRQQKLNVPQMRTEGSSSSRGRSAPRKDYGATDAQDVFADFPWGNWNIPPANRPKRKYVSFVTDIAAFERILVTPRCVTAHFPNSYASSFASLPIPPPAELPTPPRARQQTRGRYYGELGSL